MTLKDILIAGKLTISEGGGGGGGDFETGEITIAETVTELTIPVTATWSNLAMVIDMKWADVPAIYGGGGDVLCARGTASDYSCLVRTAASVFFPCDRTPSWRGDKIQFNADSIYLKLHGNGTIAEFPAGVKYRWVAW